MHSLWGVVVGGFVVVGALVVQVTPGASQLVGVVRHGQSVGHRGHVVHLRTGNFHAISQSVYLGSKSASHPSDQRENYGFFVSDDNILVSHCFSEEEAHFKFTEI